MFAVPGTVLVALDDWPIVSFDTEADRADW